MTKAQKNAFNKAYLGVLKSNKRRMVKSRESDRVYESVVPVAEVIKHFSKFVKKIDNPKTTATANKGR